jgi:hypothetical protein
MRCVWAWLSRPRVSIRHESTKCLYKVTSEGPHPCCCTNQVTLVEARSHQGCLRTRQNACKRWERHPKPILVRKWEVIKGVVLSNLSNTVRTYCRPKLHVGLRWFSNYTWFILLFLQRQNPKLSTVSLSNTWSGTDILSHAMCCLTWRTH